MDFANKYIGGGVCEYGNVQEEILFTVCPEMQVAILFTDVMSDNEAVVISGATRFSNFVGYGGSFSYESAVEFEKLKENELKVDSKQRMLS